MEWKDLIGKKIEAFRGHKESRFGKDTVKLTYILFDDKETYLELREQDPYDYHDCANGARMLDLSKDAKIWQRMFNKESGFEETTDLGHDPFW